jgi:hypothetical protein
MLNIFLIGRPGCGKSVVFRIIEQQLRAKGFKGELKRIDDFPLLKHIFDTDVEHKRHRPAPGRGLKVTDDTVWDDLANGLNNQALKLQSPDRLLFIEFSRDNYIRAFKNFSQDTKRFIDRLRRRPLRCLLGAQRAPRTRGERARRTLGLARGDGEDLRTI